VFPAQIKSMAIDNNFRTDEWIKSSPLYVIAYEYYYRDIIVIRLLMLLESKDRLGKNVRGTLSNYSPGAM
jgi:hypothetical protein